MTAKGGTARRTGDNRSDGVFCVAANFFALQHRPGNDSQAGAAAASNFDVRQGDWVGSSSLYDDRKAGGSCARIGDARAIGTLAQAGGVVRFSGRGSPSFFSRSPAPTAPPPNISPSPAQPNQAPPRPT